MIMRRLSSGLKRQDWIAISIELAIVVLGVFIGTQVSNWNQERLEKRQTQRLIVELGPALKNVLDYFTTAKAYYATTRAYSDTAFAGWRGDPRVSDERFVIAAYQASQIYTFGVNGSSWASAFGSDQLRNIDDPELRRALAFIMTNNYDQMEAPLSTPYREHVREVIPEDVQDAIRDHCGDRPAPSMPLALELPRSCDLEMPRGRFAEAAAALRSHPELVGELRWHRAAVASFLSSSEPVQLESRVVAERLQKTN